MKNESMPRRFMVFGVLALAIAGLSAWLWPRPRPNLLVITLDTTRADHLGCYGYRSGKTPGLDSIAADGILCERAFTVAPLTLPAHVSLFTGLYPAETGIRTNARGRLDDSVPTLAQFLKRNGYETAAFVASFVLDAKFGLDRGFDLYDDNVAGGSPDERRRDGAAVVDAALAWLSQPRTNPFCCWVHLYDPHAPCSAHRDQFGDEFADRPYDAEIAYVDAQVGRLIEFLKSRQLDSRTVVAVVGDHGEGLQEHFEWSHGLALYNSTMHVPLIFRYSPRLPAGRRVTQNVSLVDVSATLIDLLGLSDTRHATGKSLCGALAGGQFTASPAYGATDESFLVDGCSPLRSLTDGDWKYIRTTKVELYNLAHDPGEQYNLAGSDPARVDALESQMAAFESRLAARAEAQMVLLSAAEKRSLETLGYVGATAAAAHAPADKNLPDVKDMLPIDSALVDAEKLIGQGAVDAAITKLQSVVRQAPNHTRASCLLAATLWNQSKTDPAKRDEAQEVLHVLLDVRPECRDGHQALGLFLLKRGRPEAAISEFLKAIELDPEFPDAHYQLGAALFETGQTDESLAQLNAVIELDPRFADAYAERAHLLFGLGQIAAAIRDYRQAVKFDPQSHQAHLDLATALADTGDIPGAKQHLVRAVELSPQRANLRAMLGIFLVRTREFKEAIPQLEQALELEPGNVQAETALETARQALAGRTPDAG